MERDGFLSDAVFLIKKTKIKLDRFRYNLARSKLKNSFNEESSSTVVPGNIWDKHL